MKLLGRSEQGDVIVSLLGNEYETLVKLQEASKGRNWTMLTGRHYYERPVEEDMRSVLQAVYVWMVTKDTSKQLRALADEIDESLMETKHG